MLNRIWTLNLNTPEWHDSTGLLLSRFIKRQHQHMLLGFPPMNSGSRLPGLDHVVVVQANKLEILQQTCCKISLKRLSQRVHCDTSTCLQFAKIFYLKKNAVKINVCGIVNKIQYMNVYLFFCQHLHLLQKRKIKD